MLFKYLKYRLKIALLFLIIIAIFSSAYFLFDLPKITVLYPIIVSLAIIIFAFLIDYYKFYKKHISLNKGQMIEPSNIIEEDYNKIIEKLKEEEKISRNKVISDYNNMVNYYTIWAHQIKTPIASMKLNLGSEDTKLSRILMGDLDRIEAYVEMVLTFIRLDSNSTDYVIKEYKLDDIIKESIKKFSREFILKKLSLDYKPTNYMVTTDEKWLSFIIEQVISNSVKYTEEGGVSIFMDCPGILKIKDTGIGITKEDLPRIFENGYTGFNGRELKSSSGIGLYLCKRIIDNLGYSISVESEILKGTTIIIDLRTKELNTN